MKIYREVGSLYIVNRKDAEGYERPIYEIEVDEAELIRHGRWQGKGEVFCEAWTCSVCGNERGKANSSNYCPSCGAKMDEVTDGRR